MSITSETGLELTTQQLQTLVDLASERIGNHLARLGTVPAATPPTPAQLAGVREPLPTTPTSASALLDRLFQDLIPPGLETAGPGYLAYMPSGGLPQAAVADLIVGAVNRYVSVWQSAPGLAELESTVVRWFADLLHFPGTARGYLSTGGSMANFSAVLTARYARLGDGCSGTAYFSDQTHHSVAKGLRMAGFPPHTFRQIDSNPRLGIRSDALRQQVAEDRRRGCRPFLLVATAGTTSTGDVEDLAAFAAFAAREDMWFHVDAAYGGFFLLTDRGRALMSGIELADSVTLDPHKSLFLPSGTGALLVRDGSALRGAHTSSGERYSPRQEGDDRIDFCEYSPELSRECRGLRIWLPLKLHGAGVFQRTLDEKLDLARLTAQRLAETPGIEVRSMPALTVVLFRWSRADLDDETLNRLNDRLLTRINGCKHVVLSSVLLEGKVFLRMCILSFRTHLDTMEQALEDIRRAAAELPVT